MAAPFERQTPLALRALSERSPTTRGLLVLGVLLSALLLGSCSRVDSSKRLRILTWADYVPADVVAQFERETGIHVEVTLSNNEEMISKLHATGGAGYDLAQPSQDRITGVQREFGLYKPIDLTQVKLEQFRPEILAITRRIATLDGKLYALPYLWGAEGIVVNHKRAANVADYGDLDATETVELAEFTKRSLVALRKGSHLRRDQQGQVIRLDGKGIERVTAARGKRAGLPVRQLTPHDLRATFITLALEGRVPLQAVQYAARHKDPRTTEHYQRRKVYLDDNAVDYIHY